MKKYLLRLIQKIFDVGNSELKKEILNQFHDSYGNQIEQKRFSIFLQQLVGDKKRLPQLKDVGYRIYSQNDEDGILNFLFSVLGTKNKLCLDIAFASPYGANTTNLICNLGWSGLLVCGSDREFSISNKFFSQHPDTNIFPPKVVQKWITAENINDVLTNNGMQGEIDLFSLDIDGVDYWIWKKLEVIQPRVVVVEYQNLWGPTEAKTIPYKADFCRFDIHQDYFGSSLNAFVQLAKQKGYRLVGCNKYGFNAFFVRNDLGREMIPEIPTQDCFSHPQAQDAINKRLPHVKHFDWVDVSSSPGLQ